jgi:L-Ala-D/L-Glu epimerase
MPQQAFITRISIYKLSVPLISPFITSLGRDEYARNVLIKIETDIGITGFGECSPYPTINGESQDTCFAVGQYFAKIFMGKNACDIEARVQDMDRVIYGNTSIKSALDMALYDIASQQAKLPLYAFLGGKNEKIIATDYTVSIGEPDQMAKDALKIRQDGYPAIKVKLGQNGKKDVERIKAIRHAVGNTIPLRVDANQGWGLEEAIATLNALAPFDIQHCEEPIPRWDYMNLAHVRQNSPIPIMADESCGDEHDADRLIKLGACDYFNVKLGKAGGIFKAIKIVELANQENISMQVGAFMESRLAMTAFAHFSLCSPLIVHFDFDTALMFSDDPVSGGITYKENGIIEIPEVPGLGAHIDEMKLEALEKVSINPDS